jgi:hypothetical protein
MDACGSYGDDGFAGPDHARAARAATEFLLAQMSLRATEIGRESDLNQLGVETVRNSVRTMEFAFTTLCDLRFPPIVRTPPAALELLRFAQRSLVCVRHRMGGIIIGGVDRCAERWARCVQCWRRGEVSECENNGQVLRRQMFSDLQGAPTEVRDQAIRERFLMCQEVLTQMTKEIQSELNRGP